MAAGVAPSSGGAVIAASMGQEAREAEMSETPEQRIQLSLIGGFALNVAGRRWSMSPIRRAG